MGSDVTVVSITLLRRVNKKAVGGFGKLARKERHVGSVLDEDRIAGVLTGTALDSGFT